MALFNRPVKSLANQLADKAAELRASEVNNLELARSLQQQAQTVQLNAIEDASQAAAVEEAFMILDSAGVTI